MLAGHTEARVCDTLKGKIRRNEREGLTALCSSAAQKRPFSFLFSNCAVESFDRVLSFPSGERLSDYEMNGRDDVPRNDQNCNLSRCAMKLLERVSRRSTLNVFFPFFFFCLGNLSPLRTRVSVSIQSWQCYRSLYM